MDIAVKHVDLIESDEGEWFMCAVEITKDDGTLDNTTHVFPVDTLEWRAAEYGIDPADTDTLLEMVLVEPHIHEEAGDDEPSIPHNAPSTAEARKRRLKKIRDQRNGGNITGNTAVSDSVAGKATTVLAGSGDEGVDPLEFIKKYAVISTEHIKVKRVAVQREVQRHKDRKDARDARRQARKAAIKEGRNVGEQRESAHELRRRLHVPDDVA